MEKLLLCSAYRFIEGMEQGWIKKDVAEELQVLVNILNELIKGNNKTEESKEAEDAENKIDNVDDKTGDVTTD